MAIKKLKKRETDGKYAHEGGWERLCVCGHTLGVHSAGSPADCLLYSIPNHSELLTALNVECGCMKFKLRCQKDMNTTTKGETNMTYSVLVGNIGKVCSEVSHDEAQRIFNIYVEQSKSGMGRARGESICIMVEQCGVEDIIQEYVGSLNEGTN